ncbi:acyl carrier protein [Chromobacterium sp. IIBBL 290-4]|uniref:acyl carrier protein n=1 Tax=Chromobacterium sp. IIBBL 290-4 TaxID=2953890 RepID=UPI0020B64510|nr:acyl carrier protein [Chromobacterium sp. IIBBL 290-4]UTH76453.1 acyl carrier protein [Chromobacterium sp. IIBBL 290-4]
MLGSFNSNDIWAVVERELTTILRNNGSTPNELEPDTRLGEIGISSLDLAELISNLEDAFGVDPFAAKVPITSIVTIDQLCAAYASLLDSTTAPGDMLDAELRALRAQ